MKKKEMRKAMLAIRNTYDADEKESMSRHINQSLWKFITQRKFKIIHSFLPVLSEVNIWPTLTKILASRKMLITSRILGNGLLEHCIVSDIHDMEEGPMGIKYPRKRQLYNGEYDLIIVPGLLFDANGFRIGYGGGYYDRFLSAHPDASKLGVCYSFQMVEKIPVEPHDQNCDFVIHDKSHLNEGNIHVTG